MKNTYKNPSYKIIAIDSRDMMATSPNAEVNLQSLYDDGDALVKENVTKQGASLWDDEW